jgi:hypothetical protein
MWGPCGAISRGRTSKVEDAWALNWGSFAARRWLSDGHARFCSEVSREFEMTRASFSAHWITRPESNDCYMRLCALRVSILWKEELPSQNALQFPVPWLGLTVRDVAGRDDMEGGSGWHGGRSSRGRLLKVNRAVKRYMESEVRGTLHVLLWTISHASYQRGRRVPETLAVCSPLFLSPDRV